MKYKNKMTKINNIFTYEYTYTTDDETKTFILSEHEFDQIEQIEDEKFKPRAKFFKQIVESIKKMEIKKDIQFSFEKHLLFGINFIHIEPFELSFQFFISESEVPYLYCYNIQSADAIVVNPNDISFIKELFVSTFEGKDRLKWFGTSVWKVYNNEIKS